MKDIISIGDFLSKYSFAEFLVFILIFVLAIKEGISFFDWAKTRFSKATKKAYEEQREHDKIEEEIEDLNKFYDEKKVVDDGFAKGKERFEKLEALIEMLIESDKEDIKSFITAQHHKFVYEQEWIDDYSMECLEKRFAIYEREHGNSFVLGLMNELRALPKRPPRDVEHRYVGTAEYVKKTNEWS